MHGQINALQSVFLAMALLLIGLVLTVFVKTDNTSYARKLFIGAFFVRAISVYLVYFYLLAIGGDGFVFRDDEKYDLAGRTIAAALAKGKDGYALYSWAHSVGNVGYFYFSGWLYSVLGPDTLSARMVSAFFGAFTVVFVFVIAGKLYGPKPARVAGLVAAFLPNMVFLSALQFKDAAVIFFLVFLVYLVVTRLRKRFHVISFLGLVVATGAIWFLRKDLSLPLIGIVAIWFLMRYTGLENRVEVLLKRRMSFIAAPIALILILAVFGGLAMTQAGKSFIDKYQRLSERDDVASSSQQFGGVKHGGVQMDFVNFSFNSPVDIIKLPFAVGYTFLLPSPAFSMLTNHDMAGYALYSVANLFFISLAPFVALGFLRSSNIPPADALLVRWFPLVTLIGISVMWMGVLRYKELLMPFFVIWAAIAICERRKYRRSLIGLYIVGITVFVVAVILRWALE